MTPLKLIILVFLTKGNVLKPGVILRVKHLVTSGTH